MLQQCQQAHTAETTHMQEMAAGDIRKAASLAYLLAPKRYVKGSTRQPEAGPGNCGVMTWVAPERPTLVVGGIVSCHVANPSCIPTNTVGVNFVAPAALCYTSFFTVSAFVCEGQPAACQSLVHMRRMAACSMCSEQ